MHQKACLGSTAQVKCHITVILIFLCLELCPNKGNNVQFTGEKIHLRQHQQ